MASEVASFEANEKQKLNLHIIWWPNAIAVAAVHFLALYSLVAIPFTQVHWKTYLWGYFVFFAGGMGIGAGAHRLWTHRTYKATWQLQLILLTCFTMAGQNTLFEWVRDHRVHHKFSDTDADPHDSRRGLFFSHMGWLMKKRHPEVIRRCREMDMSDILDDPLIKFHKKYFALFKFVACFLIPVVVPPLCWNEVWSNSILGVGFLRYVLLLNVAWSVNSLAHVWGTKPYDTDLVARENWISSALTFGEGWHNYHHAIPWDYKAAELGPTSINWTTYVIELFSKIGWAYDLKSPSPELIRRLVTRKGDGSHEKWGEDKEENQDIMGNDDENKFQEMGST